MSAACNLSLPFVRRRGGCRARAIPPTLIRIGASLTGQVVAHVADVAIPERVRGLV